MSDIVLVVNAGSSSIKFSIFAMGPGDLELLMRGQAEGLYATPRFVAKDSRGQVVSEESWPAGTTLGHDGAVEHIAAFARTSLADHRLAGVGHRVVHGGSTFAEPVRLTPEVITALEQFVPLAPLHQPHNLTPVRLLLERRPDLPQVACFDTAFHRGNPPVAQMFALPDELTKAGVQRYGFHGLSYEYISSVLPRYDSKAAKGRTVVLHLGNGSSMCALDDGRSVASTMGFTAVDGLMMGTRSGSLDPGVILYLIDEKKMDARAIERLIYQESGLLGVSGIASDMRTLLASDDPRAKRAIDLFVYRIRRELGSLAAALGGIDALVFTGGIGENAPVIRERICRDAAWLGVHIDAAANAGGGPRLTVERSTASAWVIPTNEELMIARHTRQRLGL